MFSVYSLTFGDKTVHHGYAEDPKKALEELEESDDLLGQKIRSSTSSVKLNVLSKPLDEKKARVFMSSLRVQERQYSGKFSVYAIEFDDKTKHHGVSPDPKLSSYAFFIDSTRDAPRTDVGRKLKDQQIQDAPAFHILKSNVTYAAAVDAAGVLGASCVEDKPWDADVLMINAVETRFPQNKATMAFTAWATEEAKIELHRLFFWMNNPLYVLEGDTLEDVIDAFFYVLCAQPRNYVSHGCVYDPRYRKCLVKTTDGIKEISPTEFGSMSSAWLVDVVRSLCHKIVAGARNDKNAKYVDQADAVRSSALRVLDLMYSVKDLDKMMRKKRNVISIKVSETLKEVASNQEDINSTFEKLRRLYPKDHLRAPEFNHYKKRIYATQPSVDLRPLLDEKLLNKNKKKHAEEDSSEEEDT